MREIKPTISGIKHKVFINDNPLLSKIPKKEFDLFIATLELEIRDYYKDKDVQSIDNHPP